MTLLKKLQKMRLGICVRNFAYFLHQVNKANPTPLTNHTQKVPVFWILCKPDTTRAFSISKLLSWNFTESTYKNADQFLFTAFHSPLHIAARNGSLEIVELLVGNGADIEDRNDEGNQAIHLAAFLGHVTVVQFLVQQTQKNKGSSSCIESRGNSGFTPLHFAVSSACLNVRLYLLDHGADIDATDDDGNTALHIAVQFGHFSMFRILAQRGSILNARNNEGKTASEMTNSDVLLRYMSSILRNSAEWYLGWLQR